MWPRAATHEQKGQKAAPKILITSTTIRKRGGPQVTNLTPERILDVRALPGTRETIAYKDGGLFPVLALSNDGVAVAALRGGAGHNGREGRMEVVRSLDDGLNWTPPNVVADSEDDDRNPAFGISAEGTLILLYHRQHYYDAYGNYDGNTRSRGRKPVVILATRSFDSGMSWEEPFPVSMDSLPTGSPFGKIISLDDATLLAPIYSAQEYEDRLTPARKDNAYLARSLDDGQTWGDVSLIALNMNETALIALPDGVVLAVLRGADSDQALHSARSRDGGRSWTVPVQVTQASQHPADLVLLSNGDILLTYGNRNPPYRVEGRISRDGGRSWLDITLTFSGNLYGYTTEESRRTDLGYPSSVVRNSGAGGRGVTMYYYNPSMRNATVGWQRAGNPLYQHENYYAIAVTWREDELIAAVEDALSEQ